MVMLQGRGAGLSLSGKPVLGPAGCQGSPGSPGAGPVCQEALFAVLWIVTEWPGRVRYSGAPPGRRLLMLAVMKGAL